MSDIKTIDELRALIGESPPGLEEKNIDYLDEFAMEFIRRSPFLILSTADEQGRCDASPKGDAPGFVEIIDDKTLLIPDRPGNRLAYGHENMLRNPHVGLIFFQPGANETLRVNGRVQLSASEALREQLAARGKPATLVIRVTVEECFFHCAKAFIRSSLWKPEQWEEPTRVSFGEIYASRLQASAETEQMARAIDEAIEADYRDNL